MHIYKKIEERWSILLHKREHAHTQNDAMQKKLISNEIGVLARFLSSCKFPLKLEKVQA